MVVFDLEKRVPIIVFRDPVLGRLKREGKQPGTLILHRQIQRALGDLAIGRQRDLLGFQKNAILADVQRRFAASESMAAIGNINGGSRLFQSCSRGGNFHDFGIAGDVLRAYSYGVKRDVARFQFRQRLCPLL